MSHHVKVKGKYQFPPMLKITPQEAQCILNIFRLYDYRSTGRIPSYLAVKVCDTLGMHISEGNFSDEVSLQELLMLLDRVIPDPEPALLSSLLSFGHLAAEKRVVGEDEKEIDVITPHAISHFMETLGRPPASLTEASLMLNSMLDYDDCSEVPSVHTEVFNRELINFAKKTNAFKDYRG